MQDVIATSPLPPQAAAPPIPSPSGIATPSQEEKKKADKDVTNLFLSEEIAVSPIQELSAGLQDFEMSKLYKECLDCKLVLG